MNIYQRLNEIKKKVKYIQKDKQVESYMAVTHDAVTAATREFFIEHGVAIVPTELSSQTVITGMVTGKGTPFIRFEAKYRVDFVNMDEPADKASVEFTAHALDHGDKAPGKAHSYATKYAVLKMLQLETGEAEEGREAMRPAPAQKGITIKATDGYMEALSEERQAEIRDLAMEVIGLMDEDNVVVAFAVVENAKLPAEEKIALWSLLDSKQRSALKKQGREEQRKSLSKPA